MMNKKIPVIDVSNCAHPSQDRHIDQLSSQVRCRVCDQVLDPISCLVQEIRAHNRTKYSFQNTIRDIKKT